MRTLGMHTGKSKIRRETETFDWKSEPDELSLAFEEFKHSWL